MVLAARATAGNQAGWRPPLVEQQRLGQWVSYGSWRQPLLPQGRQKAGRGAA